jgi:tyrosyl-tRNA synthetase
MKKAFCEPKNVAFCPPITLASTFTFGFSESSGELTVKRSPDNGGDLLFKNISDLEASFADESLHPGDLKATTSQIMVEILEKISGGIKADPEATKASKALKAMAKKLSKKGKK